MSPGMVKFLMWAGIILLVCYAANANIGQFISNVLHALQ